jgi:glycosyltransferase involved in cell wall biosynthesis
MTFDIILPTLRRDSLRQAVQSVINQTFEDWILYVVADGDAYDLQNELVSMDSRVYVIGGDFPNGDFGAEKRNKAIVEESESYYIAYIDDDDIWLANHLEILNTLLDDECHMARTAGRSFKMRHKSPRSKERVPKLGPVNKTDILTVGMAHSRDLFYETQGWLPCDNHDHLLWKEMLQAGGQPEVSEEISFLFQR